MTLVQTNYEGHVTEKYVIINNNQREPTEVLDIRGSVHHSTIHTEKSSKMQQCIKIYYSIFI
jgi:hypothetical protein